MKLSIVKILTPIIAVLTMGYALGGAVNITTYQVDNNHTGANLSETALNATNVNAANFGFLFKQTLDGQNFGQPLYMAGLTIGGTTHNVVYVGTEHDSVYAFDADSNTGSNSSPLWKTSFLTSGYSSVPAGDLNQSDISGELGITQTPVIDASTNTLYVVSKTKRTSDSTYHQLLHALDITTGAEKFSGPVSLDDILTSPACGTSAKRAHARANMSLYGSIVYIPYASHADTNTYHGLILGFDKTALTLQKTFNTTPMGSTGRGGIWGGGAGPVIDSAGHMFVTTGNGDYDHTTAGAWDLSETFIKLPTTGTFYLASTTNDFFTPHNQADLTSRDADLGSSGILILPDQTGTHTHIMISGGKDGLIYVVDRDILGGYNTSTDNVVQTTGAGGNMFCSPSYFNGKVYFVPQKGHVSSWVVGYNAGNYLSSLVTSTQTYDSSFVNPGSSAFISANGATNGIIWVINHIYHPSVLYAYDASQPVSNAPIYSFNIGYNNGGTFMDDTVGQFIIPIVDNGKVYLTGNDFSGGGKQLFVLGLLSGSTSVPSAPSNLVATPTSSSQITLTWTDNSNNESGFTVYRSTSPTGPFNSAAGSTGANTTSFADSGLSATTTYYYQVAAYNGTGYSSNTSTASAKTFGPYTPTGLVAFWNFDEATGSTATDITGNGHTGTLTGEVNFTGKYIGLGGLHNHGAGNADGRTYVADSAAMRFTASQSFTLSAWIQPSTVNGLDQAIVAKSRDTGNCYGIWLNSSNHWAFRAETGGVVTDVAAAPIVLANTWYHVAAVQDGTAGTRTLYVNGSAAASGTAAAADGTGQLWMGQANSGGGSVINNYPGNVDEVRLYNRALAASEISNLMDPPVMQAVSRQVHGGAGTFDLSMPSNGTVSIEDRRGSTSGSYQLIMTFSDNVSGSTITGTLNTQAGYTGTAVGTVNSVTTSGNTATANLTGVGDKQRLNLHLSNITPGGGTADIPINILIGDFSANGTVGTGDEGSIFGDEGQTLSTSNYRADITCDGSITSADYNICVTNQLNVLPGLSGDSTPPTIAIALPTSGSTYSTTGTTVTLSGTASDNVGVTSVTWSNSATGGSGVATGTGTWSVSGISLNSGSNPITMTAHDAANNTGTDLLTVTVTGASTVFSQNFDSSTTLSTYVNLTSPTTGQFNAIQVETCGGTFSINANHQLQYVGSGNTTNKQASVNRTTALAGPPTVMQVTMDVGVTDNATVSDAIEFDIGNFSSVVYTHSSPNIFGTLQVHDTGTNTFKFNVNGTDSAAYSANGTMYTTNWYLNKSGSTQSYHGPDGSTNSLSNNSVGFWVGTSTKVFDNVAANNGATSNLTYFSLAWLQVDSGTYYIDNLVVNSALP